MHLHKHHQHEEKEAPKWQAFATAPPAARRQPHRAVSEWQPPYSQQRQSRQYDDPFTEMKTMQ